MANGVSHEEVELRKMRDLIFGFSISRSIAVAAELGIADRLREAPRTAEELARECFVLERPLYRMLRALSGEGVFAEQEDGRFALTPAAEFLRSDNPKSLREWAIFMADIPYRSQSEMLHSLKTGESAFREAFGSTLFDYLSAHPQSAAEFYRAMSSISAARIAGVVEAYDFSTITTLVDVGGASGAMAAAIANRHPHIRCICFDLPSAEQGARKTFGDSGLADRCDFIGGDFFKDVPGSHDAYILSTVLHDWDDERCLQILRNCRRRIADNGRLLVVDIVLSDEKNAADRYRNFLDLNMLTVGEGGMERSELGFSKLLMAAGFTLSRVIPTNAPQWIIEALPQMTAPLDHRQDR